MAPLVWTCESTLRIPLDHGAELTVPFPWFAVGNVQYIHPAPLLLAFKLGRFRDLLETTISRADATAMLAEIGSTWVLNDLCSQGGFTPTCPVTFEDVGNSASAGGSTWGSFKSMVMPASLMLFLLDQAVDNYMQTLSEDVLGGPESLAEFGMSVSPAPVPIQMAVTVSSGTGRSRRASLSSTTSAVASATATATLSSSNGESGGAPASPRHTPQLNRLAARIRARTATRTFINTWPVMDGTGWVEVSDVSAKHAPSFLHPLSICVPFPT